MAENSSLRTRITSFAAQTVPASGTERSIDGRCGHSRTWARRESSHQAPDHRRQLPPTYDRSQAPKTRSDLDDRARRHPEPEQNGQHSQAHHQPEHCYRREDPGRPGAGGILSAPKSSPAPKLGSAGIAVPPLSRAAHPRGCATSNWPAMLNENPHDLTSCTEFPKRGISI
jgi:hypothetical protein